MKVRKLLVAGVLAAAAFGVTTPAFAQTDYVTPPEEGEVLGTELSRTPPAVEATVSPASTSTAGGSLPVTGGDVAGLTAIGVAAIGAGAVLVRRSRRSTESALA